jgi:hypothetical protein
MKVLDVVREDAGNLSRAWLQAFRAAYESPAHEAVGLAVEIRSPAGGLREDNSTRTLVDDALSEAFTSKPRRRVGIDTVASTIFPKSLWNPASPRDALFARYRRILPHLKRDPRNSHGMYFERFLMHDQLEHVIRTRLEAGNNRRSAYQICVFDPATDHGDWRQRGFPCLHQVSFVPNPRAGELVVFAYYATQTIFEKAYGNYRGLWDLGTFVGTYWNLEMRGLTCIAAVAKAANDKNVPIATRLISKLEAANGK